MINRKNIHLATVFLFLLTFAITSCAKSLTKGTINRDCTGTYLELDDKDYLICNPNIVEDFQDGSSVKVNFKWKSSCLSNSIICQLYHESYGFVKILKIK